ncbi:MAG: erythromycin esterase family protein [Spirosomaceae bacterium]|nr:erythromycin esterase family protein [Spirosomataceae bacterium]
MIILILFIRLFASSVLDEPFFGDTLTNLVASKEKPQVLGDTEIAKLKTHIYPINLNATKDVNFDFTFLESKIQDAEIIGLGEATHGTNEFFELKSKVFQYLVEKKGVRTFAIEANFAGCYAINEYVLTGKGNPKEALSKNGYWVWQSQEVLDLIEWMKNYNTTKSKAQKIQFYGYDMQNATSCINWLDNYLTKSIPTFNRDLLLEKFDENNENLRKLDDKSLDGIKESNLKKLNVLEMYIHNQQNNLLKNDSSDFRFAEQAIKIIRQKLNFFRIKDFDTAYSYRDSSMAQNIKWIKEENNNAKIMLWAHNGHIGRGTFSDDFKTGNWMGTHLNKLYGKKYYNVGFSFNEGGFVAQSPPSTNLFYLMYSFTKSIFKDEPWLVRNNFLKPHSKSYLTNVFSKLETPCFFLDFKDIQNDKTLREFVNKEYEHYEAGAVFINKKSALWTTNLYELFDAVIYVDKVEPAKNFRLGKFAK